jgi:hypothetical protein
MLTFKSITDVEQFRNHPLHDTIAKLVIPVVAEYADYRQQDDGYLVLVEHNDVNRILDVLVIIVLWH